MKPSFVLVAGAAIALAACGGAVSSDLFSGTGSHGGGEDAGSPGDSAPSDAGPPPFDAAPPPDGYVLPPVDGSVIDVVVDTVIDVGPVDPGIFCGASECTVGQQYCCVTNVDTSVMPPTASYACRVPPSTECSNLGGTPVACDDVADCPAAQLCCGTEMQDPTTGQYQYVDVRCQTTCDMTASQFEFCDHTAAVDECLASAQRCQASAVLPGYYVCKP